MECCWWWNEKRAQVKYKHCTAQNLIKSRHKTLEFVLRHFWEFWKRKFGNFVELFINIHLSYLCILKITIQPLVLYFLCAENLNHAANITIFTTTVYLLNANIFEQSECASYWCFKHSHHSVRTREKKNRTSEKWDTNSSTNDWCNWKQNSKRRTFFIDASAYTLRVFILTNLLMVAILRFILILKINIKVNLNQAQNRLFF